MGAYLRPHQLGFGTKGGAEGIVHAVRRCLDSPSTVPRILVKLDFKNAFNSITRDNMLKQVASIVPQLYAFLYQCYIETTLLTFGQELIHSETGCQQGDRLGPPVFCLSIQPMISTLSSELNAWYMDDGTLVGEVNQVVEDLQKVLTFSSKLGLDLHASKCEIFLLNHGEQNPVYTVTKLQQLLSGLKILTAQDVTLLGAPITEEAGPKAL
jgi:hypothetical protein